MKSFFILVLSLLSTGSFQQETSEDAKGIEKRSTAKDPETMTTYFFIRHAEKDQTDPDEKDPDLSARGKERARIWAEIFKQTPFDLIYSSGYKRTDKTAGVVADSQGKTVQFYDASKPDDREFHERIKGKKVLIVGHSNTNPRFVNEILEEKKYGDLEESEYGSLFIVTVSPDGSKESHVLYVN